METKELKISVPKGYEIDKENSTSECIRFKLIKKHITYDDVCTNIFRDFRGYSINNYGEVNYCYLGPNIFDANNTPICKQLERLLVLNQLLNIAEYYNKQHPRQNNTQYYIIKNDKNEYDIVEYKWLQYVLGVVALFNRKEDAQSVIDNPNFREILDTIYKNYMLFINAL